MQDIARGQIKWHGYYMWIFLLVKFKMAALLELVKLFSRKRRAEEEFLTCQYKIRNEEMAKKRCQWEMEFEMEASEPAVL